MIGWGRTDYGCALQREILIQGRLYISENHVCFHANIFGWVTDVSRSFPLFSHIQPLTLPLVPLPPPRLTSLFSLYPFLLFLPFPFYLTYTHVHLYPYPESSPLPRVILTNVFRHPLNSYLFLCTKSSTSTNA